MGILDSFFAEFPDEILTIGLTGQMHGIVYLNAGGIAVSPLYTWQDGRGALPYQNSTYAAHLGSFSGYGNVTDFYNRQNDLVPKAAVTYCTIQDYLGMRLCGNQAPILHTSDAASLGLFDAEEMTFRYPYAPEITKEFRIIGHHREVPVSVAIGDNQASVFSTLGSEKDLLINIGTGSQISIVSDVPVTTENIESRPYVDGKYLIVGAALCGGRAYSLLKEFYQNLFAAAKMENVDVYGIMEKFLSAQSDTTLKVDTRFDGTRSDPEIRGSISGISTANLTPADLTAGVVHGMVEELYEMYRSMGINRSGIVGSGNGVRKNKALIAVAESIFGAKLRIPIHLEEAACGAALFALVACGKYQTAAEVQQLIQYA